MDIKPILKKIATKQDLTANEMRVAMQILLSGQATPAQIGAFLIGLSMKGETTTELAVAAEVMRSLATPCIINHPHLVDIVGTGGDASSTFNISTAATFVIAAAGGCVAKHGNRAITSRSGSADVLTTLGANISLNPADMVNCALHTGIGFLFAPLYHTAVNHVQTARQEIGIRTLFNILGTLCNPAHVRHQLIGVFAKNWVSPIAQVLMQLGSQHALVVHAEDGLDEISVASRTYVAELKNGVITEYEIYPSHFGIENQSLDSIRATGPKQSADLIQQVLKGQKSTATDIVALNAGAAIYAADLTPTLELGVQRAFEVIYSGLAHEKLQQFIKFMRENHE
jgi:anthranilate phosphoribosyltransferase